MLALRGRHLRMEPSPNSAVSAVESGGMFHAPIVDRYRCSHHRPGRRRDDVPNEGEPSPVDFGTFVESQLSEHTEQLFGFKRPLDRARWGPTTGRQPAGHPGCARPARVARVEQRRVGGRSDRALARRRSSEVPLRVRRRDVESRGAARGPVQARERNATTIVTGLISCDPVRRTPWGTIIVAEEAGATGGFYELIDPVHITTADQRDRPRTRGDQRSPASRRSARRSAASRSRASRSDLTGR